MPETAKKATTRAKKQPGDDLLIANTAFSVPGHGVVNKGDVYEPDHDVVKGREHLFSKASDRLRTR